LDWRANSASNPPARTEGANMTLKIYGSLKSRAARVIWTAKELDIPYEFNLVVPAYRAKDGVMATTSPAYAPINPNARIPAIDDDGLVLFESLAIDLYLARKHGGPIAPKDIAEDAQMTMWSMWALTECEPYTSAIWAARGNESEIAKAHAGLARPLKVLEQHLKNSSGNLVGGRFTVVDIGLSELLKGIAVLFKDYPSVKTWFEATQARPAFKSMQAERVAEPD
jgi:glutathione S-transferase